MSGYVNAVERESKPLYSSEHRKHYKEKVVAGAFQKSMASNKPVNLLFNHEQKRKLGSTLDGNFQLKEDSIGLYAEATITDEEVIEKARKNELRGWSFGFVDLQENWEELPNGELKRYLNNIDLREVSILDCTPAYNAMSLEVRGETLEQRNVNEDIRVVEFKNLPQEENDEDMEEEEEKEEKEAEETEEVRNFDKEEKIIQILKLKGVNYGL